MFEGGGGGVDLALDFKNFWDGVYNFFFCPPLACFIHFFFVTTSIQVYMYFATRTYYEYNVQVNTIV